jgi:hypothetical protein
MGNQPVDYTFDSMISSLRSAMKKFPDHRTGKNTQYEIIDAAAGAFSVFFTQCPSFLSFQNLLLQKYGLSNAKALFGMQEIPSDNQIRNLLDNVTPGYLSPVFVDCFHALKRSKQLDTFRIKLGNNNNDLLIALDGTQYFSSSDLHCENCSVKIKDEETIYSHTVVTPTIVAPGVSNVISLMPEFITPQDGDKKQDCEIKASKRWLSARVRSYGETGITFLGDDLYAHEPFCKKLLEKGYNFIFTCKPKSHKTVYEWVKGITTKKVEDRFEGKTHQIYTYKYVEGVPLRDGADALLVNFVEVVVTDRKSGKQLYHNAFITNHPLTDITLPVIINCGRARWKIENENNNTLKTNGYHLEHNFGHGETYLASLLATMNILAFLFHTMLELLDEKYLFLRKVFGARKRLFETTRVLLIFHPYANFEHLMAFMIEGLKKPFPLEDLHYPL